MKTNTLPRLTLLFATLLLHPLAQADKGDDVARQLANPISNLISVPVQANYDENIGPNDEGSVWRTNVQPVIPISISDDWNVISRTIVPIINQSDIPTQGMGESGIGDVLQSLFFSPKKPTAGGYVWGVGPAFLLDTATNDAIGAQKWAAGPTGVVLTQRGPWTFGGLANHLESFAGEDKRADISATFIQPFMAYITPSKTTYGLNTESTYDWETKKWSVPVNFTINQLLVFGGKHLIQVGGGLRYWAQSPDNGPEDWGLRFQVTLLFPK